MLVLSSIVIYLSVHLIVEGGGAEKEGINCFPHTSTYTPKHTQTHTNVYKTNKKKNKKVKRSLLIIKMRYIYIYIYRYINDVILTNLQPPTVC